MDPCRPSSAVIVSLAQPFVQVHSYPRRRTYLHVLRLVVSQVDAVVGIARLARQLPSINGEGCESQTAVGVEGPASMLPLHNGARAVWRGRVGDGAVVGFLVVAVGGEGVGDARVGGLDEVVAYWIVKTLRVKSDM